MGKITMSDLVSIKANINKMNELLRNQNIAAAIDYLEKVGVIMLNIDQKAADKCFAVVDKYSNYIAKIENRVPSTYEAFRIEANNYYYLQPISLYLKEYNRSFQELIYYSSDIISKANAYNKDAFEVAYKLTVTLQNVNYREGSEYFRFLNSLPRTTSGYAELIKKTQEKCGSAFKKLIDDLDKSI